MASSLHCVVSQLERSPLDPNGSMNECTNPATRSPSARQSLHNGIGAMCCGPAEARSYSSPTFAVLGAVTESLRVRRSGLLQQMQAPNPVAATPFDCGGGEIEVLKCECIDTYRPPRDTHGCCRAVCEIGGARTSGQKVAGTAPARRVVRSIVTFDHCCNQKHSRFTDAIVASTFASGVGHMGTAALARVDIPMPAGVQDGRTPHARGCSGRSDGM